MNRMRAAFLLLSLLVLFPIATGTLAFARAQDDVGEDSQYKYITVFLETLRLIRSNYVEEADIESLMLGALQGTTDALDPFSTFVPAEEVERYRKSREIGDRRSGLVAAKERGITYVVGVAPDSPADAAGLRFGDVISRVAGESSRTLPLWRLQNLLAGNPGAELDLEILRRGKSEELKLVLGDYAPPKPGIERADGVPLIRLQSLDAQAVAAVRGELAELAAADETRLLLDLRGSGASSNTEFALDLGRMLVQGEVGRLLRRGEVVETFEGSSEPVWKGKLVVMIDQGTMGGAELLAGLLRESAGAELVGERTFGYAGRQAVATLTGGAGLFYTDAFYAPPEGEALNEGLTPDVAVAARQPFGFDGEEEAEDGDPILDRALDVVRGEVAEEELPKAA